MNPGDEAAQLFEQFEIVQIGRAATPAGIHGDAKVADLVKGGAVDDQRRDDRNLLFCKFRGETVFLEYRLIGPAVRAVELRDDSVILVDADLVNAILVAVQGEQASVAVEAQVFQRFEKVLGLQLGIGERGVIAVHAADDTLRRSRSRDMPCSRQLP